jgi:hypothetical protein
MQRNLVVVVAISVATSIMSGCSVYKEPSIDYLTSTVPDTPASSAPPVVLPDDFPQVPLVNTDYVPGSVIRAVNPDSWSVSVFGDVELWNSVTAGYQIQGFIPSEPQEMDGVRSVIFENTQYRVVVSGSEPNNERYRFTYTVTNVQ